MGIRTAERKDFERIKKIENDSFSKYLNFDFNRRMDNIEMNFRICDGGLLVSEDENGMNGFIYARALGKIGWIGTFAVLSSLQGKGIGTNLLNCAIEFLETKECEIIGLETLNTAYKNIEIYIKNGFMPIKPSFQLSKKVEKKVNNNYLINYDKKYIEELSNKILKGYNPKRFFENTINDEYGDVIELYENNNRFGCALLEYRTKLDNERIGTVTINELLIDECDDTKIKNALNSIEAYAAEKQLENIDIYVNTENEGIVKLLLESGYSIKNSRIRMLRKGNYVLNGIECSRWIM